MIFKKNPNVYVKNNYCWKKKITKYWDNGEILETLYSTNDYKIIVHNSKKKDENKLKAHNIIALSKNNQQLFDTPNYFKSRKQVKSNVIKMKDYISKGIFNIKRRNNVK